MLCFDNHRLENAHIETAMNSKASIKLVSTFHKSTGIIPNMSKSREFELAK